MSELQKAEAPNPLAIYADGIAKGLDPDKLGKLLDLHERILGMKAAEAFAQAITNFQRRCPQIEKWKAGAKGKYAPYETLMLIAGPIMVEEGIVATFNTTDRGEAGLWITCKVRVGTHSEETSIPCPAAETEGVSNKAINGAQAMGIRTSYGKRYALSLALNIVSREEDTDGFLAGVTLNGEQMKEINRLIDETRAAGKTHNHPAFLQMLGLKDGETLADCPQSMFMVAKRALEAKLKEVKKP